MYFSVLGPLEVRDGASNPLRIAGERRRTLVLRLLLVPNRIVSFDRLVDDVWGEVPRKGVRSPLAAYISLLRDQLGADRIRTEATGYVLVADPGEVDAELFEKQLERRNRSRPGVIMPLRSVRSPRPSDVGGEMPSMTLVTSHGQSEPPRTSRSSGAGPMNS